MKYLYELPTGKKRDELGARVYDEENNSFQYEELNNFEKVSQILVAFTWYLAKWDKLHKLVHHFNNKNSFRFNLYEIIFIV